MFGRDWESAQATIVARRQTGTVGYGLPVYEYVADVRPDCGDPLFRATFHDPVSLTDFRQPDVDQVVRVTFDPKSEQVKFDKSDPNLGGTRADRRRAKHEEHEAFGAVANGAPGSPTPSPAGGAGGQSNTSFAQESAKFAETSAKFADESVAFRKSSETFAAIARAKASGDQAEVERLRPSSSGAAENPPPRG